MNRFLEDCLGMKQMDIHHTPLKPPIYTHIPPIHHRNKPPLESTPVKSIHGDTPEPLFRQNSYQLGVTSSLVPESLQDNLQDYTIYDNTLRLSPICGKQHRDHEYTLKYYRQDMVLSKTCDICGVAPHLRNEASARCNDCEMYLCMQCYRTL